MYKNKSTNNTQINNRYKYIFSHIQIITWVLYLYIYIKMGIKKY